MNPHVSLPTIIARRGLKPVKLSAISLSLESLNGLSPHEPNGHEANHLSHLTGVPSTLDPSHLYENRVEVMERGWRFMNVTTEIRKAKLQALELSSLDIRGLAAEVEMRRKDHESRVLKMNWMETGDEAVLADILKTLAGEESFGSTPPGCSSPDGSTSSFAFGSPSSSRSVSPLRVSSS